MIILFDLDGTVIDSTEAIVESFLYACEKNGFEVSSVEQITSLIGYPLDVMFISVGVDQKKVWDFVNSYKEHYRKVSKEKTVLLPNAKDAIESAHTFARLGVVITKTARYSKELLEHFGVMRYFEVLIGREDVKYPKPHREPIEKALEAMAVGSQKNVYMIGDTSLDLESAKNAGIEAIGVLSGYGTKEDLIRYGFDVVKDLSSAIDLLKKRKINTSEVNS